MGECIWIIASPTVLFWPWILNLTRTMDQDQYPRLTFLNTTFKYRSVYHCLVRPLLIYYTDHIFINIVLYCLFVRLKLLFDLLWFSPQNSISLSWHQWQWQCNCNLLQFKYNTNSILLHNLFLYIFFKSLNFVIIVQYYTYTDDLIPILIL